MPRVKLRRRYAVIVDETCEIDVDDETFKVLVDEQDSETIDGLLTGECVKHNTSTTEVECLDSFDAEYEAEAL